MDAFLWTAQYETGLATVDDQHRTLVALINAFGDALAQRSEGAADQTEATYQALARYAQEHFTDEEAMMRARGIDAGFFARHQRAHQEFLTEVTALKGGALTQAGDDGARALMRFLVNWLAFHILGVDQQMARQLKLIADGATAADALQRETRPEDASARLMLTAVDDLLKLVSTRNKELSEANASLERRVAERTEQLSTALAELKAAQQANIENAKLASVGQLASGLAHEINNPLSFLGPNVDMLGEATESLLELATEAERASARVPELKAAVESARLPFLRTELPQVVKETRQGLGRVQAIVRDMKDFSRVDTAGLVATDLNRSLESTLSVLAADRKGQTTVQRELGTPPPVRCLAAQLNQTLHALLTNAFQAAAEAAQKPGTVTLRTGQVGPEVWVEIADTGPGLSADAKAHLFEPFFTTRPPGQGFGLGLSSAWNFAQRHGGRLELKSEPGQGVTARLTLLTAGPKNLAETAAVPSSYNDRRK